LFFIIAISKTENEKRKQALKRGVCPECGAPLVTTKMIVKKETENIGFRSVK
jgi:hypothetical protein